MFLAASILPAWLVLPVCGFTMLVIAAHVVGMQRPDVPPRRRRLRTAAGLVMMLIAALMAYALGISPVGGDHAAGAGGGTGAQRLFVLVWMAIVVLLGFVVALALIDAFHTARLAMDDRQRLRREMGLRLSEDLKARVADHTEGASRDE